MTAAISTFPMSPRCAKIESSSLRSLCSTLRFGMCETTALSVLKMVESNPHLGCSAQAGKQLVMEGGGAGVLAVSLAVAKVGSANYTIPFTQQFEAPSQAAKIDTTCRKCSIHFTIITDFMEALRGDDLE